VAEHRRLFLVGCSSCNEAGDLLDDPLFPDEATFRLSPPPHLFPSSDVERELNVTTWTTSSSSDTELSATGLDDDDDDEDVTVAEHGRLFSAGCSS
jgi:hypothetical protein